MTRNSLVVQIKEIIEGFNPEVYLEDLPPQILELAEELDFYRGCVDSLGQGVTLKKPEAAIRYLEQLLKCLMVFEVNVATGEDSGTKTIYLEACNFFKNEALQLIEEIKEFEGSQIRRKNMTLIRNSLVNRPWYFREVEVRNWEVN